MEFFRLQLGCLAVLIYVGAVYFQGCSKYHVKITSSHFWKLLAVGILSVIFDGDTAWASGMGDSIPPYLSFVFHALSFIGLDSTIFLMCVYILSMMDLYPKKKRFLLYIPLLVNIAMIAVTMMIQYYSGGKENGYTSGASIVICFVMIALYLFYTLFIRRKHFMLLKSEKRRGIITFLIAYAMISVMQMIFPDLLSSMSLGVTILVLGIYLNSEDPAIKELGKYYSETVMSFANLIEERDGSTGGHIKRTSRYVGLIVDELRKKDEYKKLLTRDYTDNILEAAPMHDIGKIAIPDAILQKPGKLDDEEYRIMKTHAENGGKII